MVKRCDILRFPLTAQDACRLSQYSENEMNIAILAITSGGRKMARKIADGLAGARVLPAGTSIGATLDQAWTAHEGLICVMSAGIVVRAIAPLCQDKYSDPCVLVVDEEGRHVVSLLSGHLGGGNALARQVAAITGGVAVITTASDTLGLTALDLWAKDNSLLLRSGRKTMTAAAARMVNNGCLRIFSDCDISGLPADFVRVNFAGEADIVLSAKKILSSAVVQLSARNLFFGIGCNRGTSSIDIARAVDETCARHRLDRAALAGLATLDAKIDEPGLLQLARDRQLPLYFYNRERLNEVAGIEESKYAMAALGVKAVAEPAAILAAACENCRGRLIIGKMKWKDVTIAVSERTLHLKG